MRINEATMNLIKKWEGLYLHSYQDAVGVWTVQRRLWHNLSR